MQTRTSSQMWLIKERKSEDICTSTHVLAEVCKELKRVNRRSTSQKVKGIAFDAEKSTNAPCLEVNLRKDMKLK